jgi:hypothetical protein
MKSRCNNPKATSYKAYGGRGIRVCKRWVKFENFLAGNYKPGNCRWATNHMQMLNQRNSKANKPVTSPQADVASFAVEEPF